MRDLHAQSVRRVLSLRQFKLFENADLDELATIAENLVETTLPAGTVLATAGTRLRDVHLVLDGRIETSPHVYAWGPRQAFGALEVFAARDIAHTAVAATDVRTLHLSAAEIGEVLEDNFGVLLATLRELAARVAALPLPSRVPTALATTAPLGLVERLILFRQQLPFAAARLQALATLAHASEEIMWPAHTKVVQGGELAAAGFVIIDGSVLATRDGTTKLLEAGCSIGHLETIAGLPYTTTIETTMPVRALRSGAPAILDVLEDHTDVALAMVSAFAGALLDANARVN